MKCDNSFFVPSNNDQSITDLRQYILEEYSKYRSNCPIIEIYLAENAVTKQDEKKLKENLIEELQVHNNLIKITSVLNTFHSVSFRPIDAKKGGEMTILAWIKNLKNFGLFNNPKTSDTEPDVQKEIKKHIAEKIKEILDERRIYQLNNTSVFQVGKIKVSNLSPALCYYFKQVKETNNKDEIVRWFNGIITELTSKSISIQYSRDVEFDFGGCPSDEYAKSIEEDDISFKITIEEYKNDLNRQKSKNEESQLQISLNIYEGNASPRIVRVGKFPCSIGKSEGNDVILSGKHTSRKHLRINHNRQSKVNGTPLPIHTPLSHGNDIFQIVDLGSTNGSYVNGQPLKANIPYPVTQGKTTVELGYGLEPSISEEAIEENKKTGNRKLFNLIEIILPDNMFSKVTPLPSGTPLPNQTEPDYRDYEEPINPTGPLPEHPKELVSGEKAQGLFILTIEDANGSREFDVFTLPCTIGSDSRENHITVNGKYVSKKHLILINTDGNNLNLNDRSRNGTYASGTKYNKTNFAAKMDTVFLLGGDDDKHPSEVPKMTLRKAGDF